MPRPTIENIRGLGDFASLFRWEVALTPPTGVSGLATTDELNFRCETAELPTTTVNVSNVQIRGHKIQQAGIMDYNGSISLSFVETVDSKISAFIKSWREALWATQTGVQAGVMSTLKSTLTLYRLNNLDAQIWKYELIGAWPGTDTKGTLDGSTSDFMKPSITFNYDYFKDGKI
jgi:hypothetical protein